MTYKQLLGHYGDRAAIALALGVTRQAVHNWEQRGLPLGVQYQIELATRGKLKADEPADRFPDSEIPATGERRIRRA